jgi:hypothetical protein
MLKFLGVVFYGLSALVFVVGLAQIYEPGAQFTFMFASASAISMAFFGAMCFAADDIRLLLTRLADELAPEPKAPTPAAITACDWCGRSVADPYIPCSSMTPEKLAEIAPQIQSQRCRDEIEAKLASVL